MKDLEEKLKKIYWSLEKLWLFIRPVWFQITVVLTVLYARQIFADYGSWYRWGGFNPTAFLKAILFLLKGKSEIVVVCFYVMWLSHWFYLWSRPENEFIGDVEMASIAIKGAVITTILLPLCDWDAHRINPWGSPRILKEFILSVHMGVAFLFPIVLIRNIWSWLVEKAENASNEVDDEVRAEQMKEKYARLERERLSQAPPLQLETVTVDMEVEKPLI